MKQILLRVPDEIHHRLTARAAREGRSVNAVATQILDAAIDADQGDRRMRLRAAASVIGVLREEPSRAVSPRKRRRTLESTRGLGPVVDRAIADERDRL